MKNSEELLAYNLHEDVIAFTTKRPLSRNRERICKIIGIKDHCLVLPHQTHTTAVLPVNEAFLALTAEEQKDRLEGIDAVVTNLKGVCIGVSTADCIPVLLYDPVKGVSAAIHAGWKGTVGKIVRKTVELMQTQYAVAPADLYAVIGPGISLKNFEVGDEVYDQFRDAGFNMNAIALRFSKWHLDLKLANSLELQSLGVSADRISISDVCTYDHLDEFFSARREQKGAVKCGRMFNAIMIR